MRSPTTILPAIILITTYFIYARECTANYKGLSFNHSEQVWRGANIRSATTRKVIKYEERHYSQYLNLDRPVL